MAEHGFPESLTEAAAMLRRRALSAAELTQMALERIQRYDPALNSFITVDADGALLAARQADQERAAGLDRGALHGVPLCLKDNINVAGLRTTAASRILSRYVAPADAPLVSRLKAAGAVILGKNNMAEFAHGPVHPDFGPVVNPWSDRHSPGGSSSGTAAAIAAGLALGGVGTDTGGSIRLPAAWCGLVGLKPTFGAVPVAGIVPLSLSLDTAGPLARTVADAAALFGALAAVPGLTVTGQVAGLRTALMEPLLQSCTAEVQNALTLALGRLTEQGAQAAAPVSPAEIPSLALADPAFMVICLSEATAFHLPWINERPEDYAPMTREYVELGALYPATALVRARQAVRRLSAELDGLLCRTDVLLAPVSPGGPPRLDGPGMTMEEDLSGAASRYTALFNLTGHPAVSVPCGLSADGLPLAVQVVGRRGEEQTVLNAAEAIFATSGVGTPPAYGA